MESSSDSYLHKKFKKQLSVEPKNASHHHHHHPQHRKSESGAVGNVESGEEKKPECTSNNVTDNQTTRKDNNEIVPNQSTNNSISSSFIKSSISSVAESQAAEIVAAAAAAPANLQSANNSCISYQFRPSSFDTPTEPVAASVAPVSSTTSSILYDANSAQFYTEDISSKDHNDKRPPLGEAQPATSTLPGGDKPSSGKYVCPYCTLVCSKPSVLQKHIRAHTNERPFPCNSCGFSFKTRSNLYKHCRSRTHANRVMGNKAQEMNEVVELTNSDSPPRENMDIDLNKTKPYKPRFHTAKLFENQEPPQQPTDDKLDDLSSDLLSHHINKIITKNNSIVNSNDASYLLKKRPVANDGDNNNEYYHHHQHHIHRFRSDSLDEPLNLTNKNRKRCMSEVVEPVVQKSLIKELLLKNLNSDMQCPHCKMIFQTVTELELHKLRSCKGFVKPGAKYSRSSSVNVASILTQNKNAFDNIPHLQNAVVFPLKSPGPFLGKTRLVESDKNKSFSFDDGMPSQFSSLPTSNDRFLSLSPLTLSNDKDCVRKAAPVKLFGGEVKITHTSGETKSFKIDNKETGYGEYSGKLSENRVVKSGLQSGGTVLTNKATAYVKQEPQDSPQDMQRNNFIDHHEKNVAITSSPKYTNMMDFSQQAVKLLTPNLKQPNLRFTFNTTTTTTATTPMEYEPTAAASKHQPQDLSRDVEVAFTPKFFHHQQQQSKIVTPHSPNLYNPVSLLVNGKVVRYVPGIPGPVAAEEPIEYNNGGITSKRDDQTPDAPLGPPAQPPLPVKPKDKENAVIKPPAITFSEAKKFARPNSLALKPTTASLKQHHGLTPTMFNQILISPDTPRVAKKYVQQFLHGNYFSYLGLKCSTKPVYCTLNKTQPFYVPHFKKLSMYSEWRQQDTKTDKLYVGGYDSRQKQRGYVTAGKAVSDLVVHSSYKFVVSPDSPKDGKAASEGGGDQQKTNNNNNNNTPTILGGYECNDDYTYIRGRGRGRYVCDQCGIRCKKPSMLKKHIRTHSNDRPYTCSHCNFSFKTKGNLTKHMKSKSHTKNSVAGGSSSSSTQQSGTQSSESDTDDSGMDSSDESTRREEHEAAYGLLSLAQKSSTVNTTDHHHRKEALSPTPSTVSLSSTEAHSTAPHHPLSIGNNVMNTEEIAYVFKSNYAKNKILDEKNSFTAPKMLTIDGEIPTTSEQQQQQQTNELRNLTRYLGKTSTGRPLTYPYNTSIQENGGENNGDNNEPKNIKQFHVIQKYAPPPLQTPKAVPQQMTKTEVARPKGVQLPPLLHHHHPPPILKVNDVVMDRLESKKRAFECDSYAKAKLHRADMEVMDLSMPTTLHDKSNGRQRYNGSPLPPMEEKIVYPPLNPEQVKMMNNEVYSAIQRNHAVSEVFQSPMKRTSEEDYGGGGGRRTPKINGIIVTAPPAPPAPANDVNVNFVVEQSRPVVNDSPKSYKSMEYDNSAMETLAEIATKQVKLEKNTLAKSVASEFLKLATKNESDGGAARGDAGPYAGLGNKDVGEMIVKSEGSKSCSVCLKNFSKPSQLRLHMNIHYLERPFRCHSCSVSFRTKGHLQKHERSASHHNKLSSSPALSSSEPRPFKCVDCNIAFRIHGHLAKHLRSKMHIMKLECLAKIPFGLYAELERSNSLLTEINTADGDQCLESLKTLAKKVFINDPNKLNQLDSTADTIEADS